jgi:hypothetical protein
VHRAAVRYGLSTVAGAIALAACSSKPPPPPDPNAFPADYKIQIAGYMRSSLDNPSKLRNTALSPPVLKLVGSTPHYVSCVRYSQRNSSNQYAPVEDKAVLFLAGSINQFVTATPELCGTAAYQPFPEAEVLIP